MREALKFLGGSVTVYLIVAACSSSNRHDERGASNDRGGGGARARGGAGGTDGPGGAAPGGESTGGMMGTAGEDGSGGTRAGGPEDGGPRDSGPNDSGMLDGMVDPVPDAMADSGSTSGTRLKARFYAGADGSRQLIPYLTWYDTERAENCAFTAAPDGVVRCMPQATTYAAGSYFADLNCAQQLAYGAAQCGAAPARYAQVSSTTTCGTTYVLHQVGAAFVGATVYIKSGVSCTATPTPATLTFYPVGAEVPWSAFVTATEEVEP